MTTCEDVTRMRVSTIARYICYVSSLFIYDQNNNFYSQIRQGTGFSSVLTRILKKNSPPVYDNHQDPMTSLTVCSAPRVDCMLLLHDHQK